MSSEGAQSVGIAFHGDNIHEAMAPSTYSYDGYVGDTLIENMHEAFASWRSLDPGHSGIVWCLRCSHSRASR